MYIVNQTIKELIRLNIKPNFAALSREYGCDYRTDKIRYYEELNKEKGIEPKIKIRKHIIDEYKEIIINIRNNCLFNLLLSKSRKKTIKGHMNQ